VLTHAPWTAVRGLQHGFLDRQESGAGSWAAALGSSLPIVVPRQVHGTRVVDATAAASPEADAVASGDAGLLVGVVTADCVPVLLVDRRGRLAAAVHAGWRGTAAGILEATVDHLCQRFETDPPALEAAIGPAIGGCCYEIGAEVVEAFRVRSGRATAEAWSERAGRRYLDLRAAARLLLGAAGVTSVTTLGPCTACGTGYHSYRRDGARTGRQLSFVGWA
jgi:purine-nucleoside/S-methyl-5'-thioadenosine phosphorylase / adenosine deaminase